MPIFPGLRVLAPATVEDARYMLQAALADPNPVLIFEHVMLYNMEGELDPTVGKVDIGHAKVRRPGRDVTLVTYGGSLFKTLAAAEMLAKEGIDAEVIDLRVLRPLDMATVAGLGGKDPACGDHRRGLDARARSPPRSACALAEDAFFELDAPLRRVCGARGADALRRSPRAGGTAAERRRSRPRRADS